MNKQQILMNTLDEAGKTFIQKFMELLKERGGEFWAAGESQAIAEMIKPFLKYLSDEELNILANKGKFLVAQAVADFLVPRIKQLGVDERITLGQVITYHRVWTALINTALPHHPISYELASCGLERAKQQFQTY